MTGKLNHDAADVAELSRAGKVELVGSTARSRTAGGIRVDAPARQVAGARSAGGGILYRGAWVYAVRGGRVRAVGVASRSLLRSPKALRSAMRRVLTAKATSRRRAFIPNVAQTGARGRITGQDDRRHERSEAERGPHVAVRPAGERLRPLRLEPQLHPQSAQPQDVAAC